MSDLTWEEIKEQHEAGLVSMSIVGRNVLTGQALDRLPPHLWEPLRIALQDRYRRATGEEFAVLEVHNDAS